MVIHIPPDSPCHAALCPRPCPRRAWKDQPQLFRPGAEATAGIVGAAVSSTPAAFPESALPAPTIASCRVIPVRGEIRGLAQTIRETPGPLVLDFESWGGDAEEALAAIQAIAEHPAAVVAWVWEAFSGAALVATHCARVFMHWSPKARMGCFGIVGPLFCQGDGVRSVVGSSEGKLRAVGQGSLPVCLGLPTTEKGFQSQENFLEKRRDHFSRMVATKRGIPVDHVLIQEGASWSALICKEKGLIDEIGNLEDAIAAAVHLSQTEKE